MANCTRRKFILLLCCLRNLYNDMFLYLNNEMKNEMYICICVCEKSDFFLRIEIYVRCVFFNVLFFSVNLYTVDMFCFT